MKLVGLAGVDPLAAISVWPVGAGGGWGRGVGEGRLVVGCPGENTVRSRRVRDGSCRGQHRWTRLVEARQMDPVSKRSGLFRAVGCGAKSPDYVWGSGRQFATVWLGGGRVGCVLSRRFEWFYSRRGLGCFRDGFDGSLLVIFEFPLE